MKKKIVFFPMLLLILMCCLMTACNKVYHWEIAQSVENISKIEIVDVYNSEKIYFLCEIDSLHYEEVVQDIQTINAKKYFGSLKQPYGKSFKITFIDGKYDLISECEPKHVLDPEQGLKRLKCNHYYYDSAEFEQLIEKWSSS